MAPEGAVPAFLFARPLRVLNPQLWAKRFGPGRAAQKKPADAGGQDRRVAGSVTGVRAGPHAANAPMQLKDYNRVSYVFTRLNAEAHARPRPPHQIPVVRLLARTE